MFNFRHSLSDYQFLLTLAHLRSQLQSGPPLTPMMMSSLLANPLNSTPLVANSGTREIMDQLLQLQMQQNQTVLALQQQLPTQVNRGQFEQNLTPISGLTSRLPVSTIASRPTIAQKRKSDSKNDQIVPNSTVKDRSSNHESEDNHETGHLSDLPAEQTESQTQTSSKRRKYSSEKKSYRIVDLLETSQDENVDIEVIEASNHSIPMKPLTTSTPKKSSCPIIYMPCNMDHVL